jgi:hypothetical protein
MDLFKFFIREETSRSFVLQRKAGLSFQFKFLLKRESFGGTPVEIGVGVLVFHRGNREIMGRKHEVRLRSKFPQVGNQGSGVAATH